MGKAVENLLGPSSGLGFEIAQSFPDSTGSRTNVQHVCDSMGSNPLRGPTRGSDGTYSTVFPLGPSRCSSWG